MKALIRDNIVVQVSEEEFQIPEPFFWVDCPDDCRHGWHYDPETGTVYAPKAPEDTKAERIYKINQAISDLLRGKAVEKGYDDAPTVVTYLHSTTEEWRLEAEKFVVFRDACWNYCIPIIDKIEQGFSPMPAVEEVLSNAPTIEW
jgi:hypothetical protein